MIAIPRSFRNSFFAMRHGQSEANVARLIASHPEKTRTAYGLTQKGVTQAKHSAMHSGIGILHHIYSSPILRAVETAHVVSSVFEAATVHHADCLRERFFGSLDLESDARYADVWAWDMDAGLPAIDRAETADRVAERMLQAIRDIDQAHQKEHILIVSHGDSLDILYAVLRGLAPGDHRRIPFSQAEIRPFPIPCRT